MRTATFDIETNGFLPTLTRVWCAVVQEHGGERREFTPDTIQDLCLYLEQFDVLEGHNHIAFDFPALRKVFGWEYKGIKWDTLLVSRTQRPNRPIPPGHTGRSGHSVAAFGVAFGSPKVEHEEWDRYTPHMLERCHQDVTLQVSIGQFLREEGKGEGWGLAHRLNMKLFHYLQLQEEYGWLIDQPLLTKTLADIERWMGRIDRAVGPRLPMIMKVEETKKDGEYNHVKKPFKKDGELSAVALRWAGDIADIIAGPFSRINFRRVDLDKNLEVKEFLLAQGWKPTEWNKSSTGKHTSPKLSKDDKFEGIQGSLGKLIVKRIQCKQRRGTLEGWQKIIRPDGRIAATVGGIATTGRLRHKDIVNVPSPGSKAFLARAMRSLFISQPGWVMVGVDSKGNQIRQLAARMGDENFTNAVLFGTKEEETDFHSITIKTTGVTSRNLAKNFFYGFVFGAGDALIGKIIKGTAKDGKALKEKYLNGLPKLREWMERITKEWRESAQKVFNRRTNKMEWRNGYITGIDGRPIQVDSEHKLVAFYLQSDEAIQMAAAYCWFHSQMERRGYIQGRDYGTVIWMHDEYQFECKKEISTSAARIACESIAWAGRFYNMEIEHEGESKIGKNWYETH